MLYIKTLRNKAINNRFKEIQSYFKGLQAKYPEKFEKILAEQTKKESLRNINYFYINRMLKENKITIFIKTEWDWVVRLKYEVRDLMVDFIYTDIFNELEILCFELDEIIASPFIELNR